MFPLRLKMQRINGTAVFEHFQWHSKNTTQRVNFWTSFGGRITCPHLSWDELKLRTPRSRRTPEAMDDHWVIGIDGYSNWAKLAVSTGRYLKTLATWTSRIAFIFWTRHTRSRDRSHSICTKNMNFVVYGVGFLVTIAVAPMKQLSGDASFAEHRRDGPYGPTEDSQLSSSAAWFASPPTTDAFQYCMTWCSSWDFRWWPRPGDQTSIVESRPPDMHHRRKSIRGLLAMYCCIHLDWT